MPRSGRREQVGENNNNTVSAAKLEVVLLLTWGNLIYSERLTIQPQKVFQLVIGNPNEMQTKLAWCRGNQHGTDGVKMVLM